MVRTSIINVHVLVLYTVGSSRASSLCSRNTPPQTQNTGTTRCGSGVVMVIGALSFLGSRTAAHLMATGAQVRAVTHDHDITGDELLWYRRQQLENMGLHVTVANLSNQSQVQLLLTNHLPTSVVYVPPGLDKEDDFQPSNDLWAKYLEEFVIFLEVLRTRSLCTRVLLTSKHITSPTTETAHMTVLQAWMETFELTLATYHNLYDISFVVLRMSRIYGPWGASVVEMDLRRIDTLRVDGCYVSDVVRAIERTLQLSDKCEVLDLQQCTWNTSAAVEDYTLDKLNLTNFEPRDRGIRRTIAWAKSYAQQRTEKRNNVIFTSYFTTAEDSQRNRKKAANRFQYMKDWFLSVKEQRLQAVVFHDGMDAQFRQRLLRYYPNVTYHCVQSLHNRSTNDARFYAYLTHLQSQPEIGHVLLTDISDVRLQMNPFQLMNVLGDWLYIGTDIDIFPSMQTMPWIHERLQNCFGNYSVQTGDLRSLMELDTVYNAGVIGGSRHTMLATLTRIVEYLDVAPHQLNCNMPAVNYAVHKHFFGRVFTGFPLTSRFLRRQLSPQGVYIVHK